MASATFLQYMSVMDCGSGQDLEDIVFHQNIAGVNPQHVLKVAISIAKCLQFLNEKCNIMHGDVKPRNFIASRNEQAKVEHSIRLSGKIHVDRVDGVDNADRLRAAWKDFVEKTKL